MIYVGEEIKKLLQFDMISSLIKADTKLIDGKHSENLSLILLLM